MNKITILKNNTELGNFSDITQKSSNSSKYLIHPESWSKIYILKVPSHRLSLRSFNLGLGYLYILLNKFPK